MTRHSLRQSYLTRSRQAVRFKLSWDTTPLGTALYGTVTLRMTLKAESLNDLPFFQGIREYTGVADVEAATVASVQAAFRNGGESFLKNSGESEELLAKATVDTLTELTAQYARYIGKTSQYDYTICVTTDDFGAFAESYADCNGVRRSIHIYDLESAEKMKQNGKAAFCETLAVKIEERKMQAATLCIDVLTQISSICFRVVGRIAAWAG